MLAAVEAGGTKFVCAVGDDDFKILDKISFSTTYPEETLQRIFDFFDTCGNLKAIGIGSFGPIDINKDSKTYGYITSTPKTNWRNFNFLGAMKRHYDIPIGWTTDVNAACLGEYEVGSASDNSSCLYLTVGTGIGGGAILNGKIVEGFGHTEMGHIIIRNHPEDDFEGVCPFHKNCLEGLAAGPSIEKRYGIKAQNLDADHKVWRMIAYYLAQALMNYTLILRPEKIILGGGVMNQARMIDLVREEFSLLLANYVETPDLDSYIVTPSLGDHAAIVGGLILAQRIL
ncbi:ROK family protein [Geosporobacter ferrireducens]|uniref:fructokinase n=1 Tax=Geosporobacter ferrireducens TaxID=1424294 RepID=A0A1D8GI92_9FIRM|nr:ROK family protein [Geosporobacter ferrireducens]AOT70624.1 fructokinase [Geosporobacter ferrireducens]MTI57420.1 ROK family protein [Geosporobacter ferrireducens]